MIGGVIVYKTDQKHGGSGLNVYDEFGAHGRPTFYRNRATVRFELVLGYE